MSILDINRQGMGRSYSHTARASDPQPFGDYVENVHNSEVF